jgi:hypothetical protein
MPSITTKIDRDQRDGLYELVRNHLGSIGDLWIALEESSDYASAERLGREFAEDFRLLRDIGWKPSEYRRDFALTMPATELTALLGRLREEAETILIGSAGERRAREEDTRTTERFQLGYEACGAVLSDLKLPADDSA